jgi:hypothetical protein
LTDRHAPACDAVRKRNALFGVGYREKGAAMARGEAPVLQ